MDSIEILKLSFIVTNIVCSLIASVFLFATPSDIETHKKVALRYFVLFFLCFGLGYATLLLRAWIPTSTSVLLSAVFYLSACYCLLFGIRWWYGERQHLYCSPLTLIHITAYTLTQFYLVLEVPNSFDTRVNLSFLNYMPVFALALIFVIQKSNLQDTSSKILTMVISADILIFTVPWSVHLIWDDTLLYYSSIMAAQNTLMLIMLGAFFSLFLFDKLQYHYESSITDELTGLYNRRHFLDVFNNVHSDNKHSNTKAGLVICDIDNFKRINDTYGHHTGDLVLQGFADCLRHNLTEETLSARYGGEEFTILLPGKTATDAEQVAEQLRKEIAQLSFDTEQGPIAITASFGVSETDYQNTPSSVIQSADKALYDAKNAGRNQVQVELCLH